MSELLKINNLWGGYKEGVDILRGISMDVQQGEAVGKKHIKLANTVFIAFFKVTITHGKLVKIAQHCKIQLIVRIHNHNLSFC